MPHVKPPALDSLIMYWQASNVTGAIGSAIK